MAKNFYTKNSVHIFYSENSDNAVLAARSFIVKSRGKEKTLCYYFGADFDSFNHDGLGLVRVWSLSAEECIKNDPFYLISAKFDEAFEATLTNNGVITIIILPSYFIYFLYNYLYNIEINEVIGMFNNSHDRNKLFLHIDDDPFCKSKSSIKKIMKKYFPSITLICYSKF